MSEEDDPDDGWDQELIPRKPPEVPEPLPPKPPTLPLAEDKEHDYVKKFVENKEKERRPTTISLNARNNDLRRGPVVVPPLAPTVSGLDKHLRKDSTPKPESTLLETVPLAVMQQLVPAQIPPPPPTPPPSSALASTSTGTSTTGVTTNLGPSPTPVLQGPVQGQTGESKSAPIILHEGDRKIINTKLLKGEPEPICIQRSDVDLREKIKALRTPSKEEGAS